MLNQENSPQNNYHSHQLPQPGVIIQGNKLVMNEAA
jgi:hypothetical protein